GHDGAGGVRARRKARRRRDHPRLCSRVRDPHARLTQDGADAPWRRAPAWAILPSMARRLQELLHPAQDGLLDPVRHGEVEAGERVTGLALVDRLECAVCGYGIARALPPEWCPMCHSVDAWTHAPWRPFSSLS